MATPTEELEAKSTAKSTKSFALNLFGEEALVALFTLLTAWIKYEDKLLDTNPELALAGRKRLEKYALKLDKLLTELFG